jgi:hypothetical protein
MFENVDKKNLNLWGKLLPLTIFTKEIGMVNLGGIQFDIISYPFFMVAFSIFLLTGKLSINKKESIIFLWILVAGVVIDIIMNLPLILFFKQYIPIILMYFSVKYILLSNNPIYVFERYIDYAVIAAVIGVVQLMLKPMGILFLTDYAGFFIDSVALEPSHYVVMILPAVLYLYLKKEFTWKFWVLFITVLFTFKLTALLSIIVFFIIVNLRQYWKFLIITIPIVYAGIYFVNTIPEFSDRVNAAFVYVEGGNLQDVRNMTTFSFFSNFDVATNNFINTYGLGVGLGGHETTYLRNFDFHLVRDSWYGLNYKSAHALTIRIISELGILGFFIFFMLFYKSLKIKDTGYKAVALSSLGHFIAKSFKLGSYFDYGTIFFLVMIIVLIKLDKKKRKEKKRSFIQ